MEEIEYETVLHSRFGRWRYPGGFGARFPDFVFDGVPYLDLLLRDLGLRRWRKGSAVKEVLEAYGPEDYRGLVGEWKELHGEGIGRVNGGGDAKGDEEWIQVQENGLGKGHQG